MIQPSLFNRQQQKQQEKMQQSKIVLILQFTQDTFSSITAIDDIKSINCYRQTTIKNTLSGKLYFPHKILMFDAIERIVVVSRSIQTVVAFVAGSHSIAPYKVYAYPCLCYLCQILN